MLAELLRRSGTPVIVAANKSEARAAEGGIIEAYALGLGDPVAVSAEHGEGMGDLIAALSPLIDAWEEAAPEGPKADLPETDVDADDEGDRAPTEARPLRIAIVGRPNAGKSTLVNAILGHDRMLTGPEAGITRDAIAVRADWGGTPVRVFDTAGMRKRAKVQDKLEKLSVADGLRAVRFAEVVVVLLDAAIPFETQDLRIADLAESEGRAVVVAVNKWDLEPDRQGKLRDLREAMERLLPQLRGAPLVTVSAETGRGLDRLRDAVLRAHAVWNRRVPTAALNRWLVRGGAGAPAARARGPPDQAALRHAGQDAPARLRGDVLAPREGPGELLALPGERLARGLRHARHADPVDLEVAGRPQPLQGPQASPGPSKLRKHLG